MNIKNAFALLLAILAPCLAASAQTTAPPEPATVAPLVGPDSAPTNNPAGDEVVKLVAFDAVSLPDAVRALALQAGLNIQFDPRLLNAVGPDGRPIPPPTVTEKWHDVTAMQALNALLDNWGWQLTWDPRSRIGRITAKDPAALDPLFVTVIELKYSNPTNIILEVQPTLSVRSTIIADLRTHQLVVRTTEKELAGVEALIEKLDTATRQVLIEAKIIETTKDINSAKGIDWTGTLAAQHVSFGNGLTAGQVGTSSQVQNGAGTAGGTTSPGGSPITGGGAAGGLSTIVSNSTTFLTSVAGNPSQGGGFSLNTARGISPATAFLNADGVQAVISFLNTDADTKSIAFPRTVALDGVLTDLQVVQNIPVFEQQQSAATVGAAPLATVRPNYDLKVEGTVLNEVGVKLSVLPRIAGPTNILMELRPEISQKDALEATDTLNGEVSTSPIFDRRRITTIAAVPSGYTLVLGGLDSDNVTKNFTKVPFLGDIPFFGNFFRSNSKNHSRDTILLFVTPTIIQDSDFQPAASRFLQRKGISPSNVEEAPWDTAKPYDWTKPKPQVAPSYEP